MVNVSDVLFPILFADDSNVFINGKNSSDLADIMNEELKKTYYMVKCQQAFFEHTEDSFYHL